MTGKLPRRAMRPTACDPSRNLSRNLTLSEWKKLSSPRRAQKKAARTLARSLTYAGATSRETALIDESRVVRLDPKEVETVRARLENLLSGPAVAYPAAVCLRILSDFERLRVPASLRVEHKGKSHE